MKAIDYLDQFAEDIKPDYSELTLQAYTADLKKFFQFINNDLEQVTRDDIDRFIAHVLSQVNPRTNKPLRPQTVNKKLIALRRYKDWINANTEIKIFVEIKLLEIQRQECLPENLLTAREFERMLDMTEGDGLEGKQARALLFGLYYTGMRISEILQIKVKDVESLETWVKGKGGKYREIPISNKLKSILDEYIRAKNIPDDGYVFMNRSGANAMSRQTAHRIIKKYGGKAKIKLKKVHLHNLRHLFCLTMLEKGATIEEVADLAGHSNINTTRRYAMKSKSELRDTLEKL